METSDKGIELLFSFFDESEQINYQTPHKLISQSSADTCAAACVRMILADFALDAPESYLASALDTSDGAFLSRIPPILKDFGLRQLYEWRNDLSFADLNNALKSANAIVSVKRKNSIFGHALVIDAILNDEIRLRDPLPLGQGKSYAAAKEKFTEVFFRKGETGTGVIYVE